MRWMTALFISEKRKACSLQGGRGAYHVGERPLVPLGFPLCARCALPVDTLSLDCTRASMVAPRNCRQSRVDPSGCHACMTCTCRAIHDLYMGGKCTMPFVAPVHAYYCALKCKVIACKCMHPKHRLHSPELGRQAAWAFKLQVPCGGLYRRAPVLP